VEIGKTRNCVACVAARNCVKYINNTISSIYSFPISTSVDITVYECGKMFYIFYNIAQRNIKKETFRVDIITNILAAGSVSPGLDAPRVAGSFPNSPSKARWVRETSSHPRCVQSRTHRTCKYVWFYHMPFR
jgi:hypothetical protein